MQIRQNKIQYQHYSQQQYGIDDKIPLIDQWLDSEDQRFEFFY